MKVIANQETCLGYANCVGAAPEVFDIDDDTAKVKLLVDDPPEDLAADVREAVRSCPSHSLSLEE